jgi:SNF2 family DNA or RNA helicase
MLEQVGVKFLYFFGSMKQEQKDRALEDFRADPDKKILVSALPQSKNCERLQNVSMLTCSTSQIMGLKCGGQSLNLVVANRVILVDPWWNLCAEKQAFCRVFRMGQKKETHLVRIMTTSEIDERIDEMQIRKSEQIDRALQDDGHVHADMDTDRLHALFMPKDLEDDDKRKIRKAEKRV